MSPEQLFADLEIDLHRWEASRYTLDFGQRQMYMYCTCVYTG